MKDLTNVTFRDELPKGVTLVPGTTKLVDNANPDGKILADATVKMTARLQGDEYYGQNMILRLEKDGVG